MYLLSTAHTNTACCAIWISTTESNNFIMAASDLQIVPYTEI